jgi:ABC-type hemin transport system ATPase subunit
VSRAGHGKDAAEVADSFHEAAGQETSPRWLATVGHRQRREMMALELVGGRDARSSMARALPHLGAAAGPAQVDGDTPSRAVDMRHQSEKQGRAVVCCPVEFSNEWRLGQTLGTRGDGRG